MRIKYAFHDLKVILQPASKIGLGSREYYSIHVYYEFTNVNNVNTVKLFNCVVHTDRPSQCWFLCLLQEDVGNRELCVIHLVEEHARERSEEGHCISHEEEPITARSQAEGPVSRPGTDQLPGGT